MNRIYKHFQKLIKIFGLLYWKLKCVLAIRIEGTEGLSRMIEIMPQYCLVTILMKYGASIKKKCVIERGIIIHRPKGKLPLRNFVVGNNVYIGHKNIFDLSEKITINDDSAFGAFCQFWTHTGNWTYDRTNESDVIGPIQIGKSVICYSSVIIGPRVTIGDYARLAAGSVATHDIEAKSLYGGTPARLIKKRDI
jgi:acetyltransferase-like isoleucine patch superfamily enzyme